VLTHSPRVTPYVFCESIGIAMMSHRPADPRRINDPSRYTAETESFR